MVSSGFKAAFAAMTGVGVLIGGAGASDAGLVQTFSVDEHSGPTSQALNFDAATPNQGGNGALTAVTIDFSTLTVGGGDQVTLTGAEGGSASRGGITAGLAITDTAGTLFSGTSVTAASTCSTTTTTCTGPLMSPSQPVFSPGSPVVITDGGALADFVGSPVQITALIGSYNVTAPTCVIRNGTQPVCGGFDDISWSPTVTISYTYDTTAVPEPAAFGILSLGWATLMVTRRRGRSASTRLAGHF